MNLTVAIWPPMGEAAGFGIACAVCHVLAFDQCYAFFIHLKPEFFATRGPLEVIERIARSAKWNTMAREGAQIQTLGTSITLRAM
jgi:hypothetical protein